MNKMIDYATVIDEKDKGKSGVKELTEDQRK